MNKTVLLWFLVGNKPVNSQVCGFFTTNDPLDDWNVYMFKGDAIDSGYWTDYPAISLTDDLFITGNLLLDGVSWQLDLKSPSFGKLMLSGYNGVDSLEFNLWSDIKDDSINIRNIHPIRGARELQDKKQYFLSNKNFSLESDTLYLLSIENSQISGDPSFEMKRSI